MSSMVCGLLVSHSLRICSAIQNFVACLSCSTCASHLQTTLRKQQKISTVAKSISEPRWEHHCLSSLLLAVCLIEARVECGMQTQSMWKMVWLSLYVPWRKRDHVNFAPSRMTSCSFVCLCFCFPCLAQGLLGKFHQKLF
jgi:hypothetical protein